VPHSRRCREISARRRWLTALAVSTALLPASAFAATPSPSPHPKTQPQAGRPVRIDVTKVQPKSLLPKHVEHTEFTVEINKLGQVTRIKSQRWSDSATFNTQTYGNALQTFIRTPDGHVVLGTYVLTYDFDPKTARVRRDVSLVSQGGVDPNAKGAASVLIQRAETPPVPPSGAPAVDPRDLPALPGITDPTPAPSPH
jgi:hypothetical protein